MASDDLIDATHDPALACWLADADGHPEFPVQNLPLCVFSIDGDSPRGGVAIGKHVIDLRALAAADGLDRALIGLIEVAARPNLNSYCALSAQQRRALRVALSAQLCEAGSALHRVADDVLKDRGAVTLHLPMEVGDYTDFFASVHHARNAGRMFRPDNPLLPNYWHVPIAYHGRASSVVVSGTDFERPVGQTAVHGATEPKFGPSERVDFELELAIWIGGGNAHGEAIAIDRAGEAIVGFGLLNDWSARDIQAWETQPLGPFLGKNFLTTVSPFLVTAEALAPFRVAAPARGDDEPKPLPYLLDGFDQRAGAFDIRLEALIRTRAMREAGADPVRLAGAAGRDLIWTPAQMIAHHTVNGCNLRPGDLFGSGTVSSADADGRGSLLELTLAGREPLTLPNGEQRAFLEDGDEVILRGWCERKGFARIGLGEARGTVRASRHARGQLERPV